MRDAPRHRGILLELAHRLAYDRAHVADGAPLVHAPVGEFGQRVGGHRGELGVRRLHAVHTERLEEQRRLRSEEAEQRHFVDAGFLRDAAGGRSPEAVLAVEVGGGVEDLVAGRCGHGSSGDFSAAEGRGCKWVLAWKQADACTECNGTGGTFTPGVRAAGLSAAGAKSVMPFYDRAGSKISVPSGDGGGNGASQCSQRTRVTTHLREQDAQRSRIGQPMSESISNAPSGPSATPSATQSRRRRSSNAQTPPMRNASVAATSEVRMGTVTSSRTSVRRGEAWGSLTRRYSARATFRPNGCVSAAVAMSDQSD